jgi:hypothetical protein
VQVHAPLHVAPPDPAPVPVCASPSVAASAIGPLVSLPHPLVAARPPAMRVMHPRNNKT